MELFQETDIPGHWHAYGIILLVLLIYLDHKAKRSNIFWIFLWNFIGVALHEVSHLCVGWILNARPVQFSLIPQKTKTGWCLGAVKFESINALNAVPIGMAPLGLAGAGYIMFKNWFTWMPATIFSTAGLYTALFLLLYNAMPSKQDFKVALNWKSILLYGAVLASIAWIWSGVKE